MSKCGACSGTMFEIKEAKISRAAFRMYFVQCSACGAVIGTLPYQDTNANLEDVKKTLISEIHDLGSRLARIEIALRSR